MATKDKRTNERDVATGEVAGAHKVASGPGHKSNGDGKAEGPSQRFKNLLRKMIEGTGMSHADAVNAIAKQEPSLHKAWLKADCRNR